MRGNQIRGAAQDVLLRELGRFVMKMRIEQGMTREALSCKSGVATDAIQRFENEVGMPSLPKFIDIVRALGAHETPISQMAPSLSEIVVVHPRPEWMKHGRRRS